MIACGWWLVISFGQGKHFFGNPLTDRYVALDGELLKDESGQVMPFDPEIYLKFGTDLTFADDPDWERLKPPSEPEGVLGWK